MMTVGEVINHLGRHPEDLRVVVNGYEKGYDDLSPEQIRVATVALNTGVHDWEGRHGDADDLSRGSRSASKTVEALVLRRTSN